MCVLQGVYEPNKRHWLKVWNCTDDHYNQECIMFIHAVIKMKKDYLHGGAMADTADLVVLGAYYGTGNNGIFHIHLLMYHPTCVSMSCLITYLCVH
jgi:DNA ligase-3